MPIKDPDQRKTYYRRYMRRKRGRGELNVWETLRRITGIQRINQLVMEDNIYTIKEAAFEIGIHPNTLRRWLKDGRVLFFDGRFMGESDVVRLKKIGKWKSGYNKTG